LTKLSEISESYDYDFGRLLEKIYQPFCNVTKREIYHNASEYLDQSMALANKLGLREWDSAILGLKAKWQVMLRDFTGASASLDGAEKILLEHGYVVPIRRWPIYTNRFLFEVNHLEEAMRSEATGRNHSKLSEFKKRAHKSGRAAIKLSRWVAMIKPETQRLMGTLCWLENRQKHALNYWDKSLKSAKHLGSRPELARTYVEVGKRLFEKKSRFQDLKGIRAEEYFEKARQLFTEMNLKWDLEELEKTKRRE